MAKRWKCARCGTENEETTLTCSNCRMIRGAVYVRPQPTAQPPQQTAATPTWPATPPDAAAADGPDSTTPASPPDAGAPALGPSVWAAGTQPTPVEPSAPTPLWRRLPLQWIFVGVLVLAGGIGGWIFSASRGDTGEITKEGDLTATDLRIGDCFDLKDPTVEELTDVTARPCSVEHEYELFFTGSMADGDYPSDDAFDSYMSANCIPAFEAYVGRMYEASVLDIYWLVPTGDGWDSGDHSIQCSVYHPRISRLTGSLKGSAQ